jgi:4-amino-4-deoxy-L-arabinose transferase-like glycosyltransferase
MNDRRLLTPRDAIVWTSAFALVALLLIATGFTSDDPDSALYAGLSARLAQEPPSRWIAPQWWGFWPEAEMTGLFREHPAGILLIPAALTRIGIPAEQSAYVVGIAAGLLSLVFIAALVQRATSRDDARAALLLLQFMPVAFIFRIRANHEYPMLLCLAMTLWGLSAVRRTWAAWPVVAAAMTAGLLVKGVFVVLIVVGAALWLLLDPLRERAHPWRPWIAVGGALAAMLAAAAAYDAWYLRATGETFWLPYWRRQLGPVTLASPLDDAWSFATNFGFYVSRLVWHPAPWSVAVLAVIWRRAAGGPAALAPIDERTRRGFVFAVAFALLAILVLTPSSRFAERYAFSATHAIAAAGAVAAYRLWPRVRRAVSWIDASVPAAPAVVWLVLMLLRIVGGPVLPRL